MNWTQRQIDAIEKDGMNLLVSAAAGSGKTAVLVERVKRLVLEDRASISELLVVTFTNAAASEMKEKIFISLNKALAEPGLDPASQQRLRQQISLVGRANISTFHAFAYEIVRNYYYVIGKAPGLSLCDETRQSILKAEAMEELFENLFESGDPAFIDFLDRYATAKSDQNVRDMILSFHRFLQSLPDPKGWARDQQDRWARESVSPENDPVVRHLESRVRRELAWITAYLDKATDLLGACADDSGVPCLPDLTAKNRQDAEAWRSILILAEQGRFSEVRRALAEGIPFTKMTLKAAEKSCYTEELKTLVNELRDIAKNRVKKLNGLGIFQDPSAVEAEYRMMQPVLETMLRLAESFDRIYAEKKQKQNLLDFSDVEHFALDILQDPEVCREYRQQFRYIFIDEYQDSNGVQEALIRRICRKDNLFMVGDVKQSIYKFRLAEPELFIDKYLSYKSGSCPESGIVDLNSNFRSKKEIIELVNRIFSSVMHPEATGLSYDSDAALVKGCVYEGPLDSKPVMYLVDTGIGDEAEIDEAIAELKAVELEALQAAAVIRDQLGRIIHDDKAGHDRPLEYRDMALLMRAVSGNGEVYYQTLADAGIPVILERNEGYFDTIEIQVFLNLLRLIDNRKQDIPLLSVLRSPIFGFTADELAAVRIESSRSGTGKASYNKAFLDYASTGAPGPLKEKCVQFLEKLEYWRDQAAHRPLADFLWSLMIDTEYSIFVRAIPGGTQRQANLRALVDKAAAYEAENFGGLHGFIRHAEYLADRKGKVDVGQAGILAEGADAVRIMTIHKSKGLEFPFVLLAGLNKRILHNQGGLPLTFHKDMGLGFRMTDSGRGIYADSLAYRMINDRIRQEELAEAIRILYVAMTRPQDRLALLAAVRDPSGLLDSAKAVIPGDVESCRTFLEMILSAAGDALPVHIIGRDRLVQNRRDQDSTRAELNHKLKFGFEQGGDTVDAEIPSWLRYLEKPCFGPMTPDEPVKFTVSQLAAMDAGAIRNIQALTEESPEAEAYTKDTGIHPFVFRQPVFLSPEKKISAADTGTAYHSVLERIPLTENYESESEVSAFLRELVMKEMITPLEASAVDPGKIAAFFRSDIGRRVQAASRVFRETSFVMKTAYRGSSRLVQGTIDCCFQENGQWILVDYKSGHADRASWQKEKERLLDAYRTQMILYKEALEKITRIPVREAVLYILAAEDQLTMTY